jgi:hypothetical protein
MGLIYEKNGGQKSRDTVPLTFLSFLAIRWTLVPVQSLTYITYFETS